MRIYLSFIIAKVLVAMINSSKTILLLNILFFYLFSQIISETDNKNFFLKNESSLHS